MHCIDRVVVTQSDTNISAIIALILTHLVTREFGRFNHNPTASNDMYQYVPYCKVVAETKS